MPVHVQTVTLGAPEDETPAAVDAAAPDKPRSGKAKTTTDEEQANV